MLHDEAVGLLLGAVALGAIHGIEPGHGWPIAASYALDQTNKWLYGFMASVILGVGHLVSSIAMVAAFFYAKEYFNLTRVNEPITVVGDVQIGGPVSLVAGTLLVILGLREYLGGGHSHGNAGGHSHGDADHQHEDPPDMHVQAHDHDHHHSNENAHDHDHDHSHGRALDDSHTHDVPNVAHGHQHRGTEHDKSHDSARSFTQRVGGVFAGVKRLVPFSRSHGHSHAHGDGNEMTDRGLWGIAWFAFLLGFAHEEEFEIIALCAGSNYCLELMSAYALTVIVGIVGLTMLLISGYQHFEEDMERYTPYLPMFSAAVLIVMGVGFIIGLF